MKIIELLSKINKINYEKTNLYQYIKENENLLNDYHVKTKIKTEIDLFNLEILVKSLLNKWTIDKAYDKFYSEYSDTFAYINYEEKRKMFNNDLAPVLEGLPHLIRQDKAIYIPYLNDYFNVWYREDYSILLLRQHKLELEKAPVSIDLAFEMYGNLYQSDFSSLIYIDSKGSIDYYYFDEMKSLYLYDNEKKTWETCFLCDKKYQDMIQIEQVKALVSYIKEENELEALNYLVHTGLLNEKYLKKFEKKIKKG